MKGRDIWNSIQNEFQKHTATLNSQISGGSSAMKGKYTWIH